MAENNPGKARNCENDKGNSGNPRITEDVQNVEKEGGAPNVSSVAPVGLEAVLGLLTQVLARLPVAPPVADILPAPVGPAVSVTEESHTGPSSTPSYLKVVEHMQRLGTKFFTGGAKLIEADEWMCRLQRNFDSIRCPEEFKTDIAIHHLEGEAHAWWLGICRRRSSPGCSWETFCKEFREKYFPPEALDRLEGAFMRVSQGSMTVREYETEFNNLKRYSGHEMEEESAHVRRFMRGLRIELRKICLVRNYSSMAELVEKAAQLEGEIEEEAKIRKKNKLSDATQFEFGNGSGQMKEMTEGSKSGKSNYQDCSTCGKRHSGVCRVLTGECFKCGELDHKARDCPGMSTSRESIGSDPRICYNCGEVGHVRPKCPKLVQSIGKQAKQGQLPPAKRQAIEPRVYTMARVPSDPSTSRPAIGDGNNS